MRRSIHATALAAVSCILSGGVLSTCGGTTGREGLPVTGSDASYEADTDAESGVDETSLGPTNDAGASDEGSFDATVQYADANRLPHFEASAGGDGSSEGGGGADAGAPPWIAWPACACDYVDPNNPIALPVPDDAGGCPTFVWSYSATCDACIRFFCDGPVTPGMPPFLFPPCCDLQRDGGVATAGPATGELKFQLCASLYSCILDNLHPPNSATSLYCGTGVTTADCEGTNAGQGPKGPCKDQFESAFETTDPTMIINNFTNNSQGKIGSEGTEVANLLVDCAAARTNCPSACFAVHDNCPSDASSSALCFLDAASPADAY